MEWNLQSRAHACQACGESFADQQAYHTLLFDERSGYTRQDLCERCWAKRSAGTTADRKDYISHWQGVFEVPPPQPELIRKETAETLLRKLVSLDDPRYQAAVFILAVMLERKRLLKVKDELQHDGRRVFIYEQPRSGDVFSITDPALSLDQLDEVQHDVGHLLQHGLPVEVVPQAANPSPEPTPPAGDALPPAQAAATVDPPHTPTPAAS